MVTPRLRERIPHNGALLVCLLALIVITPMVSSEQPPAILELFFDLVLLSGVVSIGSVGRHRIPFGLLTVVTLVARWADLLTGHASTVFGAGVLSMLWVAYAIFMIVPALFRERDVTVGTIFGAVIVYLLAALAFTFLYGIIEFQAPGSFSGMPEGEAGRPGAVSNALFYFSMTSLTTMGYGDIVPISPLARPISVLEGAFGQLYLAVMIGRLVGLHIAAGRR